MQMNPTDYVQRGICPELAAMAERELLAFTAAVAGQFGHEQSKLSAEDWLNELAQIEFPRQPTSKDWRRVTIAAASRLASRVVPTM
jgi:hypothetical protein